MTIVVKDASNTNQTIVTNNDLAGTAGVPSANVLSVQGITSGTPMTIVVSDTRANGTINAAASSNSFAIAVSGQGTASFTVSGLTAAAATLTIEASDDAGTTWAAINGISPSTGLLFTTLTADQQFRVNSAGRTNLRLRVTSTGSGTVTVYNNLSPVAGAVALSSPIPVGNNQIGTVALTANSAASLVTTSAGTAARVVLVDPTSGVGSLVQAFHNTDNQTISNNTYGLFTGGVAQIVNQSGTLDRQRGTGFDLQVGTGIPSGAANYAILYSTTLGANITLSGSAQSVVVASSANIKVGSIVRVGVGTGNQEDVYCTAVVDATHFSGVFTKNHTNGDTCNTFLFNVARDAGAGDAIPLAGLSASMTYLWNAVTNLGELDRSADGERDGASGKGTAVASEFEWNGGGPANSTGYASLLQFDRARSLQAKGNAVATQSAGGAAGATSITVSSAAAANSLIAGQQIVIDRNTANAEAAYVSTSYVSGTAAINLQSGLQFAHTAATVEWDTFASGGPGLNGFNGAGIGIEEEAIYNPVDGKYYIERAATQDAMPANNIVAESMVMWNGATMDRCTGSGARGLDITVKPSATAVATTVGRIMSAASTNATSLKGSAGNLYNFTVYNNTGTVKFLKLYNKATAPTVGTDTPIWTCPIPPNNFADIGYDIPKAFSLGVAYAITGAAADSDTTAVALNDVMGQISYV